MALPRVYDIAKELGIDSKVALAKLIELGEFVKSGSSTITPPVAKKLREAFPDAKPAAEAPKKTAKSKAVAADATDASDAPAASPKPGRAAQVAEPDVSAEPAGDSKPADVTPSLPAAPASIPRPGNNPFASSQGMGIPRPVARPGNNPFAPSQGMGRPGQGRPGGPVTGAGA